MLLFQYISCCSLSFRRIESRTNHYMFQYISCCSLSHPKSWKKFKSKRFNTSHVVVYLSPRCQDNTRSLFQYISCCSLSVWMRQGNLSVPVSIHLMLQFICTGYMELNMICKFQYISCCSLSRLHLFLLIKLYCFNTSHVVVYRFS